MAIVETTGHLIGTTGILCAVSLIAQSVPAVPDGTPTTMVGTVIAALMISLGLVSLVVKELFSQLKEARLNHSQEAKDDREKFIQSLEKVERAADARADKIAMAVDTDGKEDREQRRREAEQQAELADRNRQLQTQEHQTVKELLNRILNERGGKP